jgi:hypothetical protein
MSTALSISNRDAICYNCNMRFKITEPGKIYTIICNEGVHTITYSTLKNCIHADKTEIRGYNFDRVFLDEYAKLMPKPKSYYNKRKNQPAYTNWLKHYGKNK